jgi:hypothetical protein
MPGRGDAVVLGIRSLPVAVLFVYQRRLSAALETISLVPVLPLIWVTEASPWMR